MRVTQLHKGQSRLMEADNLIPEQIQYNGSRREGQVQRTLRIKYTIGLSFNHAQTGFHQHCCRVSAPSRSFPSIQAFTLLEKSHILIPPSQCSAQCRIQSLIHLFIHATHVYQPPPMGQAMCQKWGQGQRTTQARHPQGDILRRKGRCKLVVTEQCDDCCHTGQVLGLPLGTQQSKRGFCSP